MSTPAIILLISSAFMFFLFRGLWQMINYEPKEGELEGKPILKMFLPAIISMLVVFYYFIFVLPNQSN